MRRAILYGMAAALLIAGCAPAPAVIEKQQAVAPPEKVEKAEVVVVPPPERAPRLSEELELLLVGVNLLNRPDRPEPARARPIFDSLIQRYPQGRWRATAEAFIRLIDEWQLFQEADRIDRLLAETADAEKERVARENETLRKTVRELMERVEKLQTEAVTLAKEKEQLRQDLQKLKALEIELERRDRMLR
ncbi:MAG: hypothetical protein LLG97_20025 [Deltaproteobacteria bacterium]|nr:hypothetical protein [Deltaproteobacteria bacterium]